MAKDRELPEELDRKMWHPGPGRLVFEIVYRNVSHQLLVLQTPVSDLGPVDGER